MTQQYGANAVSFLQNETIKVKTHHAWPPVMPPSHEDEALTPLSQGARRVTNAPAQTQLAMPLQVVLQSLTAQCARS